MFCRTGTARPLDGYWDRTPPPQSPAPSHSAAAHAGSVGKLEWQPPWHGAENHVGTVSQLNVKVLIRKKSERKVGCSDDIKNVAYMILHWSILTNAYNFQCIFVRFSNQSDPSNFSWSLRQTDLISSTDIVLKMNVLWCVSNKLLNVPFLGKYKSASKCMHDRKLCTLTILWVKSYKYAP